MIFLQMLIIEFGFVALTRDGIRPCMKLVTKLGLNHTHSQAREAAIDTCIVAYRCVGRKLECFLKSTKIGGDVKRSLQAIFKEVDQESLDQQCDDEEAVAGSAEVRNEDPLRTSARRLNSMAHPLGKNDALSQPCILSFQSLYTTLDEQSTSDDFVVSILEDHARDEAFASMKDLQGALISDDTSPSTTSGDG